jgi:hypothetical protein
MRLIKKWEEKIKCKHQTRKKQLRKERNKFKKKDMKRL